MEKYLIPFLFFVCSATASAEPYKTTFNAFCEETDVLFKALREESGEEAIMYSHSPSSEQDLQDIYTSVWVNKETGTMTIVKSTVKHKVSCIISIGEATVNLSTRPSL